MNTPAHLVFAAAFAKPGAKRVTIAALIGGFLPDASLYLLAGWSIFIDGRSPSAVFGSDYFSPAWQAIFAIDNSVFVWGAVIAAGALLKRPWLLALGGAALLHIAFDLPLHHDDGRAHFWPITTWVFESPISYWDNNHHAGIVAPLEALAVAGLSVILWRRFKGAWSRAGIALLAMAELAPAIVWGLMFSGHH